MENCVHCGNPLKTTFKKQPKFCSEKCRNRYYYLLARGQEKRLCVVCGADLKGNRKKYCSDKCRQKAEAIRLHEKRKADYEEYKSFKKIRPKKRTKPKMSLNEVMKRAKVEGLTYGQFVAKYKLD